MIHLSFKMVRGVVALLCLAVIGVTFGAHTEITVHYEPKCPKCQDFINNQLIPTLMAVGGVQNSRLHVHFVPYGNAKTQWIDGKGLEFVCEIPSFDLKEPCLVSKGHSCTIAMFPIKDSTPYIGCSLENISKNGTLEGCSECAKKNNIDWELIKKCVYSWEGNILLAANGIAKSYLSPAATEHPWILINGEYSKDLADGMKIDSLATLCKIWKSEKHDHDLPKACDGKV